MKQLPQTVSLIGDGNFNIISVYNGIGSGDIYSDMLLLSLRKLQEVKSAKPEPFSLDCVVSQARERLRVSIEANAAYSLMQFKESSNERGNWQQTFANSISSNYRVAFMDA